MPSPFPGMDPYIEHPDIWQDFHHSLASEIRGQLNAQLVPRYYAAIEVFVSYDDVEIGITRKGWPDVGVVLRETQTTYPILPAVIGPMPVESRVALDPLKLYTVEIRTANDRQLITSIEILSPVNKHRGHKAFESYHRKRLAILSSDTHLIEIDFLRHGERPPLLDPVPPAPYYITLSRVEKRPTVQVWPIQLKDKLPAVPVPLLKPDPDVMLDLNITVATIYERGAYAIRIDYRQPPPPPELSPEEQAWVASLLKPELQNA
jgi:hypothetical protein